MLSGKSVASIRQKFSFTDADIFDSKSSNVTFVALIAITSHRKYVANYVIDIETYHSRCP